MQRHRLVPTLLATENNKDDNKDDKKDDKKEDKGSSSKSLASGSKSNAIGFSYPNTFYSECKQCGKLKNGTPSCCATGGSWEGSCGTNNQGKPYTWTAGIEACEQGGSIIFASTGSFAGVVSQRALLSRDLTVNLLPNIVVRMDEPMKGKNCSLTCPEIRHCGLYTPSQLSVLKTHIHEFCATQ